MRSAILGHGAGAAVCHFNGVVSVYPSETMGID